MISDKVADESELYAHLKAQGFEPTAESTATGVFWRDGVTGCHILVPNSVQGYYPRWLTDDMFEAVKQIKQKH